MRRLILGIAIGAVGLLGTSTAQAGALTSATFSLQVGTLAPLSFVGSGTAAGSAIASTSVTVAAGNAFQGMQTVKLKATQAPPLTAIQVVITKNEAIKVTATASKMPLFGNGVDGAILGKANQKAFGGTLIAVPISAGISGTQNIPGTFMIKAVSKKWTSGMTTVTGIDKTDKGATSVMATGKVMTGTPGTVTLVAVSKINVTGVGDPINTFSIAKLEMTFAKVPEPAMPLMLVAGAGTLALVGGRKLRRS